MQVKDVMNRDVKTIKKGQTIKDAAELMSRFRIGSLIVVDDSRVIGIITERDILNAISQRRDIYETHVEDIMTKKVIMVDPELDINEAVDIMLEKKIKKLPVLKGNRLVGIITATDICAAEPKIIENLAALLVMPGRKLVAG
ncbi:MAG: CBS domain-containing protein [Candidatus Aenigmatarchaeota archaeon]